MAELANHTVWRMNKPDGTRFLVGTSVSSLVTTSISAHSVPEPVRSGDEKPEFDPDPAANDPNVLHNTIQLVNDAGANCETLLELALKEHYFSDDLERNDIVDDTLLQMIAGTWEGACQ